MLKLGLKWFKISNLLLIDIFFILQKEFTYYIYIMRNLEIFFIRFKQLVVVYEGCLVFLVSYEFFQLFRNGIVLRFLCFCQSIELSIVLLLQKLIIVIRQGREVLGQFTVLVVVGYYTWVIQSIVEGSVFKVYGVLDVYIFIFWVVFKFLVAIFLIIIENIILICIWVIQFFFMLYFLMKVILFWLFLIM